MHAQLLQVWPIAIHACMVIKPTYIYITPIKQIISSAFIANTRDVATYTQLAWWGGGGGNLGM